METIDDIVDLAGDEGLRLPEQMRYACSPDPWVRRLLAENPGLALQTQFVLAKDDRIDVVLSLAANPHLDPTVQEMLMHGGRVEVLAALAGNTALTDSLMVALALPGAGDRAGPSRSTRAILAGNPALPAEAAHLLAGDPNAEVRRALAGNVRLPPQAARVLAGDVAAVRDPLAGNPALPADAVPDLLGLGADPSAQQRRHDLSPAARTALARRGDLPLPAQRLFAADEACEVREGLAGNPCLEPQLQHVLMRDGSVDVRAALAANPRLDPGLQLPLATAGDATVALAVARRRDLGAEALHALLLHVRSAADMRRLHEALLQGPGGRWWAVWDLNKPLLGPLAAATTDRPDLLELAAASPDRKVRLAAVVNSRIREEQVRALLTDDDVDVRAKAGLRLLGEVTAA